MSCPAQPLGVWVYVAMRFLMCSLQSGRADGFRELSSGRPAALPFVVCTTAFLSKRVVVPVLYIMLFRLCYTATLGLRKRARESYRI